MARHCFSPRLRLADDCQSKRTVVARSYSDAGRESAAHTLTAHSRVNSFMKPTTRLSSFIHPNCMKHSSGGDLVHDASHSSFLSTFFVGDHD